MGCDAVNEMPGYSFSPVADQVLCMHLINTAGEP